MLAGFRNGSGFECPGVRRSTARCRLHPRVGWSWPAIPVCACEVWIE